MDLTLTAEQRALQDACRELLQDALPPTRSAELADSELGWDPDLWRSVAGMGLLGVSAPESLGGGGAGLMEEALVFEQAGAALLPGPLFPTALALPAVLAAPFAADVVPEVVSGARRLGIAWADPGRSPALARAAATTFPAAPGAGSDAVVLTGTKEWVFDAAVLDLLVVAARTDAGAGLFLVDLSEPGVSSERVPTMDGTRRSYRVTFDGVPARSLVDPAQSWPVFAAIWRRGLLLASAEAVGISTRMLELSTRYAGERTQFDRPIGTYQAVSHQIADMYMHTELARSLCYWAALELDAGSPTVDLPIGAATSVALPNAVQAAERAIQVHGGVGMTWEAPLHRYLKRALLMSTLDLRPEVLRHQISQHLLDR